MTQVQGYKSKRKDEMYLVRGSQGKTWLECLKSLLTQFGTPEEVMVIPMTAERKLARADASEVPENIKEQGFYLQMPPPKTDEMDELGHKLQNTALNSIKIPNSRVESGTPMAAKTMSMREAA